MTTLAEIKAAARQKAFAARKVAHSADTGSASAVLSGFLAGFRGVPLAGYMPIRTEIDPRPAMSEAAAHGPVCIPVIEADGLPLTFAQWEPDTELVPGPFGAQIPAELQWIEPEILVVPLVAFDAHGGRLGYGGGFYDRTLELLRSRRATLAVGFAYDAQQMDALPLEPTDQPLDLVITDTRVVDLR